VARPARQERSTPRRLLTPREAFTTVEHGIPIVLNPGQLVDDGDPVYRRFPDKFREPRVRAY
jgi:hypothetical protein